MSECVPKSSNTACKVKQPLHFILSYAQTYACSALQAKNSVTSASATITNNMYLLQMHNTVCCTVRVVVMCYCKLTHCTDSEEKWDTKEDKGKSTMHL